MDEPLRVVIDPNVLVSAAFAEGAPRRILDFVAAGVIQMVTCPRLHDEFEGVLARDRFLRWRTRDQLDRFIADVRVLAHRVSDPRDVPAVTRDPNDDYLVALFRTAKAEVLCSGDADLAAVDDLDVLSPRALLERLLAPESRKRIPGRSWSNRRRSVEYELVMESKSHRAIERSADATGYSCFGYKGHPWYAPTR